MELPLFEEHFFFNISDGKKFARIKMSVPARPSDQILANIIDKLAEFVGRNGPEFENMTKIKQQNNSKFSFLQQGKEFNDYYQYRVIDERRKVMGKITHILINK